MQNRQVLLKSRPNGIPQAEHFEIVERPAGEPREGQVLVRNQFLSVEPAMPTVRQPAILAIWPTAEPTDPAAVDTTTVSPGRGRPTSSSAK